MFAISLIRPTPAALHANDAAILIPSALTDSGQRALYSYLCAAAAGSRESQLLAKSSPRQRPWPLAVWRHPFTEETNARLDPEKLFSWAQGLSQQAAAHLSSLGDCDNDDGLRLLCDELGDLATRRPYDSMVSLLYDQDACLPSHKDDGLPGIGLSISLGAAATFAYGDETICLRSGDALFGRFGHVTHQVSAIHGAETAPPWWQSLSMAQSESESLSSWGRVRCNVQLRHGRDAEARRQRRALAAERTSDHNVL